MAWMIGVDEAGYGPNLGPLVVAASAWQVESTSLEPCKTPSPPATFGADSRSGPTAVATQFQADLSHLGAIDLYQRLAPVVVPHWDGGKNLAIADSKTLYAPAVGPERLELGVHTVLHMMRTAPQTWSELVGILEADSDGRRAQLPWHQNYDCQLPISASESRIFDLSKQLQERCHDSEAIPVKLQAQLVFPAEFNDLVQYYGSKGAALSHVTLSLVRQLVDFLKTSPGLSHTVDPGDPDATSMFIVCDKHGARNRYLALLQHHFPEPWIQILTEGKNESRYHWDRSTAGGVSPHLEGEVADGGPVEICFRTKGESFLPTALASMTAKYLRELSMRAVNEFWCPRVPNLKPTAGYPTDARKFKKAIDGKQRELGIDNHILWRNR